MISSELIRVSLLAVAAGVLLPSSSGQDISELNRACATVGGLTAIHSDSFTIKNEYYSVTFHVTPSTSIWRGRDIALNQLRLGDALMVWCKPGEGGTWTATDVLANMTRMAGVIREVRAHSIVLFGDGKVGDAPGRVVVFINTQTSFAECARSDLVVGRGAEVSGLDMGHNRVLASAVRVWP
jgi:hypothetical protein